MTFGQNDALRRRGPVGPPPVEPACMTRAELDSWREVAGYVNNGTADPCTDCLPDWAAEMRAEGRCNGIPGLIRKASRKPETPERIRGRLFYITQRCRALGIDPAHAERVG